MIAPKSSFRKIIILLVTVIGAVAQQGVFESHSDVGITPKKGSVEFNSTTGEYKVTGGGANVWATTDAFQFAWKRVSGDVTITADVQFVGSGAVAHRKAMLMIRQSLDPDSAYADVALHGDGLTSLQFRPTAGVPTQEMQSTVKGPQHIRLERRGNQFTIFAGKPGENGTPAGPATINLQDPVYVGIGVCSHDAEVLETAVFSNVKIETPARPVTQNRYRSRVAIYDLHDKTTRALFTADQVFEAPNWSPDGNYLLVNSAGSLFRLPVSGGSTSPERLGLDASYRCNNDKAYSPDGKQLAISCSTPASRQSQVFLAGADGSNPKLMVAPAPSYFHGWSPDGRWLAFVGQRDGNFDLFRVPVTGGPEERLTSDRGYDDGPDYSPDGKWIYFNSDRAGGWDIWRIPAEGGGANDINAERITSDDLEDWFPHPSPDGKWLLFLSFPKGTAGHNDKLNVELRMIPMPGTKVKPGKPQVLSSFFGGQGTINVNSWSPDSKKFAYVIYEKMP